MGGMFESKPDKASRKLARSKNEEKAKKKTRKIAIAVITSLLVLSAVAITLNSGIIRRTVPVVTVGGVRFTTTEFEYFFNSEFMEYVNEMSQFQGMGGAVPDVNRPLSSQVVDFDQETGEPVTWADIFVRRTFDRLASLAGIYTEAQENGFVLSDEQLETIEDEVAMVSFQAMMSGFPSANSLLQQMFGSGMNESAYREILKFTSTVAFYHEHVREGFIYSAEDLAGYYTDNRDSLDIFNYRQFIIQAERPDAGDFENDEDYDAAVVEAITQASLKAAEIAESIASEDDFIAAAMEYDEMLFSEPESTLRIAQGEWLSADINYWLLDESRDFGDVTVIDMESGSHVMFFISRDSNIYRTVGFRQILILRSAIDPEEYPEGENDPEYMEAREQAEREARERAELANSLFIAAGETEAALLDLMEEHSDDFSEGGHYTNITKFPYQSMHLNTMKVVPEIEEWLFYENRMIGDSELIYTNDFGYHLVYFTGFGEPFFELIADDRMRTRDHNAWLEGISLSEPEKHFAFILVQV
jgi:hypothetical protein